MPTTGGTARQGAPDSQQGFPVRSTMGAPNPRYAIPTDGGNDPHYHDSPVAAWAPPLYQVPGSTPDPHRVNTMQQYDMRPAPNAHPEEFYLGPYGNGRDTMFRHGVEFQDADGWETPMGTRPIAADPRRIPPPEPRLTSRMAPRSYTFTRPFDQHSEREFNGVHFSMADHRRTYPILGMQTPGTRRNTYRADPAPWDANLVDMPNPGQGERPGQIIAYDIPPSGNRGWRL